jgi:hypothetical protein
MNAAQEARLDAQAKQMAFELGYGADPRKAEQPSNFRPVTDKQVAYIKSLLEERDVAPVVMALVDEARVRVMAGKLSSKEATEVISELLASPRKVAGQPSGWTRTALPSRELSDGIYVVDGDGDSDIYKVYVAVHGSGQLCVKRLVIDWDGVMGDPDRTIQKKGTFRYMGLAAKHLPAEARRMSLDEAKQFGAIYGFCVRCGRTLTDEASIAAGIGPICAEQM